MLCELAPIVVRLVPRRAAYLIHLAPAAYHNQSQLCLCGFWPAKTHNGFRNAATFYRTWLANPDSAETQGHFTDHGGTVAGKPVVVAIEPTPCVPNLCSSVLDCSSAGFRDVNEPDSTARCSHIRNLLIKCARVPSAILSWCGNTRLESADLQWQLTCHRAHPRARAHPKWCQVFQVVKKGKTTINIVGDVMRVDCGCTENRRSILYGLSGLVPVNPPIQYPNRNTHTYNTHTHTTHTQCTRSVNGHNFVCMPCVCHAPVWSSTSLAAFWQAGLEAHGPAQSTTGPAQPERACSKPRLDRSHSCNDPVRLQSDRATARKSCSSRKW